MHNKFLIIWLLLVFFSCKKEKTQEEPDVEAGVYYKLLKPENQQIYHAAFPDFGATEDLVNSQAIRSFENLAGKEIAWAYFSNNWTNGIHFPAEQVNSIIQEGKIPFIRMMPRSDFSGYQTDPVYTMDHFLSGRFDNELKQWALAAKQTASPLLVEFGTEVNGQWFPWNASYNGSSATSYGNPDEYDGMEKFKLVYRHIIDICRENGVKNITWFYHVDAYNDPDVDWNTMKGYYPGDDYIDWIGISVYGAQSTSEGWWSFEDVLNDSWNEINQISGTGKPIAVLEWGVIDQPSSGDKAQWITDAMNCLKPNGDYYGKISAVSYWHENFYDNGEWVNLRIDSSNESLNSYQNAIASPVFISQTQWKETP